MNRRHYDARVANALRDPRIANLIAEETSAHPNLAGHVALGLASTSALIEHATTPHGGEAGPHSHAEYAATGDLAVIETELDSHVGEPHADPLHDHDATYEPAGAVATHAATPHGGTGEHDHDADYAVLAHGHTDLATDAELSAHAATTHGLDDHALDGAYHTGTEVLPSTGQKNALAGSAGTPGDLNRYVTDQDGRLADARTPLAHVHDYADPEHDHDEEYAAPHSSHVHSHTAAEVGAADDEHGHTLSDGDIPAGIARDVEVSAAIAAHTSAEPHSTGGGSPLDAWPVGSLYFAGDATDPATRFGGGTWVRRGEGQFIVGQKAADADFDTAGETGGAKTHTHAAHSSPLNHTHTVSVTDPGHFHAQQRFPTATGGSTGFTVDTSMSGTPAAANDTASKVTGITASTANPAGGVASQTHDSPSHLPPYLVVYIWERTA